MLCPYLLNQLTRSVVSRYLEKDSNNLEFKDKFPEVGGFVRDVIAFCNAFGGRILVG